jgi:choline monooxygenase
VIDFAISEAVETAETLPAKTYVDPAWLELERRAVFGRTWQLVAHAEQLAEHGDSVAAEIAGMPVVVVRDGAELRGFHNVCRHRAGPVAVGCARRSTLQCRYHGWTYGLDGRLLRAPEMDGVRDFDPERVKLPEVRVAKWGPLVFACLSDDAPELSVELAEIAEPDGLRHVQRREYTLAANWKVYVDNYLEGYHVPLVHPGLHRELDYASYRVEPRGRFSIQHAPFRAGQGQERRYVAEGADKSAEYFWVFPNLMLNIYLGQLQTNVVIAEGVGRTRVVFDWFATDAPREFERLAEFSHEIQLEDEGICEAVQRGLASGSYGRGRYSAAREVGVHHFHRLWFEAVTAVDTGGRGSPIAKDC